ncbi:MAG TPA: membrane protein insertase YidC [Mycobacteriales bacterium]|jgi:YidC/Oxa1 family membrane protein insertase|nr:membrane protein insertase YidC [Mycobacteriales bacterium]HVX70323.1 membrane protein insertase YidC [Mycobacteriales bacterium]
MGFLDPLYHAVAWLLVGIHSLTAHIVGESAAWLVAVVLLTVAMRLVIFPFFVKQIRSQRAMQALQPKIKELQAKYKNDKEKLNVEMMALWRTEGVNPLAGCLPLLLQMPIFLALFHTLREIKPITLLDKQGHAINAAASKCLELASAKGVSPTKLICDYPSNIAGFPQKDLFSAAHAKLFGIAPLPASFKTSHSVLSALGGSQGSTRALCLILVLTMIATTFLTQRQLMARNGPMEGQAAQTQKIMLYIFPLSFLIYGWFFPVGVLIYWVTSNLWAMGQQNVVLRRLHAEPAAAGPAPSGPPPGARPTNRQRGPVPKPPPKPANDPEQPAKPPRSTAGVVLPPGGAIGGPIVGAPKPPPAKRPANRSNKKKKRRGR